jgi:hypothetical protein
LCTIIYCIKVSLVKLTVKSGSGGVQQNLFYNFWIFLQVSMNFGHLKQFPEFKTNENELKTPHSVEPQIGPRPAARGRKWPARMARRPAMHGEKMAQPDRADGPRHE